jgi:6-phosphofructo-2-kinase
MNEISNLSYVPIDNEPAPPLIERSKSALRRDPLQEKNEIGLKLVIIMVGLPARGKSYISKKLSRYLSWLGFRTKVFNVGNRRRVFASLAKSPRYGSEPGSSLGASSNEDPSVNYHDANFFDHGNKEATARRELLAVESLEELLSWLNSGGKIGILDATNSTTARRSILVDRINKEPNTTCLVIESICSEGSILAANIEMKLQGPDYTDIPREKVRRGKLNKIKAIVDFKTRIENYQKVYETLGDKEEKLGMSYIKVIFVS